MKKGGPFYATTFSLSNATSSHDEVVGQQHLVRPGKIIRRMVKAKCFIDDSLWAARHWKNQYCQRNRWFNKLCLPHVERPQIPKRFTNRC